MAAACAVQEHSPGGVRTGHEEKWVRTPRQIAAYHGYGNFEQIWLQGRVLANRPVEMPKPDDDWWDNLLASVRRWETDEVAGVTVEVDYGMQSGSFVTDPEGYYRATFARSDVEPDIAVATARYDSESRLVTARHGLTLLQPGAEYLVISDVDDTVIHTGITSRLRAARLTFLKNAKSRKPLDGVAALYRALRQGRQGNAANPLFYVSNSGWNMYDLLHQFIELNDLPTGPLLLRDLGLGGNASGSRSHKAETLRTLLERYRDLPAVLIGDSGQQDAALYAGLAREFPDRIIAIYIRDVDPDHESAHDARVDALIEDNTKSGVPMLRGRDSRFFAEHMQQIGLVPEGTAEAVAAAVERDRDRDSQSGM